MLLLNAIKSENFIQNIKQIYLGLTYWATNKWFLARKFYGRTVLCLWWLGSRQIIATPDVLAFRGGPHPHMSSIKPSDASVVLNLAIFYVNFDSVRSY